MSDIQLKPDAQKRLKTYNEALLREDNSIEHQLATYMDAFIQGYQGKPHPPYELLKGEDYITDIIEGNNAFDVMEDALRDFCQDHGKLRPSEYDKLAKAADALAFYDYQNYVEPLKTIASYIKDIQKENTINMDKETVIIKGMKALSGIQPRTPKDAAKMHKYLEDKLETFSHSPKAFLLRLRKDARYICDELAIAPPIHSWADFVSAGTDTSLATAKLDVPQKSPDSFKRLTVENNKRGYTSLAYFAANHSKIDLFAHNHLIGTIDNYGSEKKNSVTIYGQGDFQNLLENEIIHQNHICGYKNSYILKYKPESKERFPGIEQALEQFKESGGRVSYTLGKGI